MKKRMLFVALGIVASVVIGRAQQGSPQGAAPVVSLSQLQREAAAVQGTSLPPASPSITSIAPAIPTTSTTPTTATAPTTTVQAGATMAPVTIKSVDQLGQAVDGAYEKMKASFQELSSRVGDVHTPEEANTLIANAHESLRRYTEAARRYYQQMQTQRQADLDSDRNRVTAREDEGRRIENDVKRARDEATGYAMQLDTAQQAALTLAAKPESVDPARIRELGVLIDTLKQASERADQRATRLEHEGRQRAKDGIESAREAVNLGQRALYLDASDLASVEESAVLSEMIIESYASDFRLRSMREEEATSSTTRSTRTGFDPEPVLQQVSDAANSANSANSASSASSAGAASAVTSLREQRDQADVSRFTKCVADGTRADECMRLVATAR